eukprot:jgi/Astpho2/1845/e_gw1.00038.339.1_t
MTWLSACSVTEALAKQVFSDYRSSVTRGQPHPAAISEAASLSAIALPKTDYPLWDTLPDALVDSGKLSQLQLEGVLYACTKHQQFLPSGERAGFFIGDGAGVGKGRQISGIILDNYARGRRKHVWLSTSSDLHLDAERDLRGLGCMSISVINNLQTLDKVTTTPQEGVMFMTYSTLTIARQNKQSRRDQVVQWCGGFKFDGCLIFDECHKAKNSGTGKQEGTKVAHEVQEIQKAMPRARVVWCDAAGVSEVGNMAYMTRLGLWGPGSAFPRRVTCCGPAGVSFLEMMAMELKAEGYYVARGLSFRDAEFTELSCNLTDAQIELYDGAVEMWWTIRSEMVQALHICSIKRKDLWKTFWSAQQRFFKLLCVCLKVPCVVSEAKAALEEGFAVVIGLQTTGEAAADQLKLAPGAFYGEFISPTKQCMRLFVEQNFPVRTPAKSPQKGQKGECLRPPGTCCRLSLVLLQHTVEAMLGPIKSWEPGPEIDTCVRMRNDLLEQIDSLELPANFLDALIDQLGGPGAVAEMTGRKGRLVRNGKSVVYQPRSNTGDTDSLNVKETSSFMRGLKNIAIVSDAASTGISLHASRDAVNQRRRVHLTIELPWSADKSIQQLGRSHRSNQVSAPLYKLVVTNVGGEKRFAAAVARRLQSLGALTRGDRRAASGIDLSDSNLDSPLGRKSLRKMYDCIVSGGGVLPQNVFLPDILEGARMQDASAILADKLHDELRHSVDLMGIGLDNPRQDNIAEEGTAVIKETNKDMGDVRRFLNRILGLPLARQNLLFNYFFLTLTSQIQTAKAEGKYSEGVSDLSGGKLVEVKEPQTLWVDNFSGLRTLRNELTLDRGMSYQQACLRLKNERGRPDDRSGFYRSKKPIFGQAMTLLAVQRPGRSNIFSICRPNTGQSYFEMPGDDLALKYKPVAEEEGEQGWEEVYTMSLQHCMHGPGCTTTNCSVGTRLTRVTILSGSVVRVWGTLEKVLQRNEGSLSKQDRTMRVVRIGLKDSSSLVGGRCPSTAWLQHVGLPVPFLRDSS